MGKHTLTIFRLATIYNRTEPVKYKCIYYTKIRTKHEITSKLHKVLLVKVHVIRARARASILRNLYKSDLKKRIRLNGKRFLISFYRTP